MNIGDFCDKVEVWASDRGIYKHGTEEGQWLKAISEFGELADGIAKKRMGEVKDAIGDITVCLVNANALSDYPDRLDKAFGEDIKAKDKEFIIDVGECILHREYYGALCNLISLALHFGISFDECLELAWNEIKDRQGYMNAQGVFVKAGDNEKGV